MKQRSKKTGPIVEHQLELLPTAHSETSRADGLDGRPADGRMLRLATAAADIRAADPSESEKAFLGLPLVQVNLPHSNPGKEPIWKRKNGDLTLSIRPGWDHARDRPLGYPYGTKPRLVLYWITREALRTGDRRLYLGDSLHGFMRTLGLNPDNGTGKRSDSRYLQGQLQRLFRATISFDWADSKRQNWLDMQIAPKGELWWDDRAPDQAGMFESWIELSESFFSAITYQPVPLDMRALRALKRSSFQLDLYALAAYKSFCAYQSGKTSFVTWRQLAGQLGANFSGKDGLDNFRKKLKKNHLPKVRAVFPSLDVEEITGGVGSDGKIKRGGLKFKPCRPAVPPLIALSGGKKLKG